MNSIIYRRLCLAILSTAVFLFFSSFDILAADNPNPPSQTVKLIFVHHSTGGLWLSDNNPNNTFWDPWYGNLGKTLSDNNYFVSDTSYGWGPDVIGDRTDIGNWWDWFRSPNSPTYLNALYHEFLSSEEYNSATSYGPYSRITDPDPNRENEVIVFKSCFPNSQLRSPLVPAWPDIMTNDIRSQVAASYGAHGWNYTVANAKGLYNDLLNYFQTQPNKLFVVVTAPPELSGVTSADEAANARIFNNWLVYDWLASYPLKNVAVFDYFNVLTTNTTTTSSNVGNPLQNDSGLAGGNHHRWYNNTIQHVVNTNYNFMAYESVDAHPGDGHPNRYGNHKATDEFVPLLNVFYHRWQDSLVLSPTPSVTSTPAPTLTPSPSPSPTPAALPFRIALRVPNVEVYNALQPYRDGTLGRIPFIYYANIDVIENLVSMGAATGDNPVELGVLIGCNESTFTNVEVDRNRYIQAGVTHLIQDCERGADNLWGQPDASSIAQSLAPLINSNPNFRWQTAMQFGYMENKSDGLGGDTSVCSQPQNFGTCNLSQSYANLVWHEQDDSDVIAIFGQSGQQQTAADFENTNSPWVSFINTTYPNRNWWGISGLTDKDGNGTVDLPPSSLFDIAKKAREMGAQSLGVIWLGQSSGELFGPETKMDQFLNLWNTYLASGAVPTPIAGDADGNGIVNGLDYVVWLIHYGQTLIGGIGIGDFDNSGMVDGVDYVMWLMNFQS